MARAFTFPVSLPASGTVRRVPKNSITASPSRRQYLLDDAVRALTDLLARTDAAA
jgi:hypothetical protein